MCIGLIPELSSRWRMKELPLICITLSTWQKALTSQWSVLSIPAHNILLISRDWLKSDLLWNYIIIKSNFILTSWFFPYFVLKVRIVWKAYIVHGIWSTGRVWISCDLTGHTVARIWTHNLWNSWPWVVLTRSFVPNCMHVCLWLVLKRQKNADKWLL